MSQQFRQVPTFTQGWTPGNKNDANWYRYYQAMNSGQPPSGEMSVPMTASPFIYSAPRAGYVVISGGTVANVMVSRTPGTYYLSGQTSGMFPVSQGDLLKITYTAIPTMTFFPT
jgi:hypothetical protein